MADAAKPARSPRSISPAEETSSAQPAARRPQHSTVWIGLGGIADFEAPGEGLLQLGNAVRHPVDEVHIGRSR